MNSLREEQFYSYFSLIFLSSLPCFCFFLDFTWYCFQLWSLHVWISILLCEFLENRELLSFFFQLLMSSILSSVQSLSHIPTLHDPMDCNTPGLPVHHQLLELAQTHVHRVGDAIQPSYPLLSPSPPTFNLPSIRVFSNESALRIRWPTY